MTNLLVLPTRHDPADIGYPATFPIEIALRTASIKTICESYNISKDEWDVLRYDPVFISELKIASDGMSFRMKAKLQSEELLKTSWNLIHDKTGNVPPAVRADLIKFTIRAAGLDGSRDPANGAIGNSLQIQINLG